MSNPAPAEVQKKRLLRLSIAHYRNENCTEEEMHRWCGEEHAVHAAKIHAKYGVEGYLIHWTPSSFRNTAKTLNANLGDRWVIRDHDMAVEFWFRDLATVAAVAADPDFQALQAVEGPYASKIHVEASLGWVEQYVADGKVVNVKEDGKPDFPTWEELSTAP
ncbi:hypothetical protein QQS21_004624 [Conoideocrella luteorostrata]|uniref:EthD domain-containing protein n=1 Tax=Conoideocrella luteorostrata TaxID=1105319 RepID=A0AAJ0CR64_9HYPO|nr:hypothetical protein QQS21_004624 [Conoideocrella luteorostrata]